MPESLSDLQALERFVAENDALLELETKIGRFNIFVALGVVTAELRHSNFLAWLLDPSESNGLGGLFLRAVLMDLLRQTAPEQRLFSPIKLDGGQLHGIEIRREWRNIDLLITCEDPSFVIAVENKIRSSEHSNQLARYQQIVRESGELSRFQRQQFVYLTREGDEPSEEDWTVYSYADLYRVLTKVRAASGEQMGDDVRAFIDHYLRLIGSRFMDDQEIVELCKEIYKNHRQAIDLIVAHTRGSEITGMLPKILESHTHQWRVYDQKQGGRINVKFQPKSWHDWLPPAGATTHKNISWRQWWLFYVIADNNGKLILTLRFSSTKPHDVLFEAMQVLLKHGDQLGFIALKIENNMPKNEWLMKEVIGKTPLSDDGSIDYDRLEAVINPVLDRLVEHERLVAHYLQSSL